MVLAALPLMTSPGIFVFFVYQAGRCAGPKDMRYG